MFEQLEKYKNSSLLLKQIIQALFEQVKSSKTISHYFVNVSMDSLLKDVLQFSVFVTVQPDSVYREPLNAQKTSMPEIRVSSFVFEEVHKVLVEVLRSHGILEDDLPRLSFEILEIVEESRAQFSDTVMMVLQGADVSAESLVQVFRRFKFQAEVLSKNEIVITSGLDSPVGIKIRSKDKSIVLIGKAISIENSSLEDIEEIARISQERYPLTQVRAVENDDDWPFLLMEEKFPFEQGIPLRLLFRLLKSFSFKFSRVVKCDTRKILQMNVSR